MTAIWRDSGVPRFLAPKPIFSFFEQAIVVEVAPVSWQDARKFFEERQAILGIGPEQHREIAKLAREVWVTKRPWWCSFV